MQEPNTDKCQPVFELLDAFLDLELSTAEAKMVEAHLAQCLPCSQRLHELDSLVERLKQLPEVAMPRDLSQSIENRIAALSVAESQAKVEIAKPNFAKSNNVVRFPGRAAAALSAVAAAVLFFVVSSAKHSDKPVIEAAKPQSGLVLPLAPGRSNAAQPQTSIASLPKIEPDKAVSIKAQPAGELVKPEVASLPQKPPIMLNKTNSEKEPKHSLTSATGGDLIAEYSDLASEGSEDYGISTNEDGLYAIKL